MSGFDELIERLTVRLRVDPELRWDVANELRTHLEDSAAEFADAGYAEDEARAQAVKALGDADELAESLWQANRRRIRFRRVAKWTARVTLVPAAIVILLLIPLTGWLDSLGMMAILENSVPLSGMPPALREKPGLLTRLSVRTILSGLTEDQRFLLLGDPNARTPVSKGRSIVDRCPDNPVYYGYYVAVYFGSDEMQNGLKLLNPKVIRDAVGVLDQGERIDPENGFYNFLKAEMLMMASSHLTDYEKKIEITDRETFNRALAEFDSGLAKPILRNRVLDMGEIRRGMLPLRRLPNYLLWSVGITAEEVALLLPFQSRSRALMRSVLAYARDVEQSGHPDQAMEWVKKVERFGAKDGSQVRTVIELLVAQAIYMTGADEEAQMLDRAGQTGEAKRVRAGNDALKELMHKLSRKGSSGKGRNEGSMFLDAFGMPAGYRVDSDSMRRAEYSILDQMGLTILLGVVVLLTLFSGAVSLITMVRHPGRDDGPKLLFVGWRRIGRVCLLAIALPLAAYAVYAHVLDLGGRERGVHITIERMTVEFATMMVVVVGLLLYLSFGAVRARSAEAGMPVPAPLTRRDRRAFLLLGPLLLVGVILYELLARLGTWEQPSKPMWAFSGYGLALAGVIVSYGLAWLGGEVIRVARFRGELAHFRRTMFRSLVPILAANVILVGLICGLALTRAETSAVDAAQRQGVFTLTDEIERSSYREIRDRLAQRYAELSGARTSTQAGQ